MVDLEDLAALEHLLVIHDDMLPDEWVQQPKLYTKFARYAARCEAALEEAELQVKRIFAEQFTALRGRANGDKRVSDETLKQTIYASPEYQAAETERIAMLERSKVAAGLQRAAEQRQYALTALSRRHLGGNLDQLGEGMRDDVKHLVDTEVRQIIDKAMKRIKR